MAFIYVADFQKVSRQCYHNLHTLLVISSLHHSKLSPADLRLYNNHSYWELQADNPGRCIIRMRFCYPHVNEQFQTLMRSADK